MRLSNSNMLDYGKEISKKNCESVMEGLGI